MASGVRERLPYRADLDGLRAIAVGLVILTHARLPWPNNGGDAGVTAFFVLSGFLITSLLLHEREGAGSVAIGAFYRRRVRRLGPALVLLLAAIAVSTLVVAWPGMWALGIVASLGYLSNWVQILGFPIGPLGHTWSLAIEEQFYLAWPFVIAALGRRAWVVAVAGVAIGFVLRTWSGGAFEYFSTLTRGDAILAGCLLAITRWQAPAWAAGGGVVALAVLGLADLPHDVTIPLATAFTVLALAGSCPALGRLAPIGRRAYGLYLWNWPLTILLGAWAIPATFVAAEVSFRLVERPLMSWSIGRSRRQPVASSAQGDAPLVRAGVAT
jgi:peptidoglycan/LPS O-acetylase OafA/YrhL